MAETIAALSLVASITSLIDFSLKVVSRVHEFTSVASAVPGSLRSLAALLPLLMDVLRQIQTQLEANKLSTNSITSLQVVVESTIEEVTTIQKVLNGTIAPEGASKVAQTRKALKSLVKERGIQQALDKILKNIEVLSLYQTTRFSTAGDAIQTQLSELITLSKSMSHPSGKYEVLPPAQISGNEVQVQLLPQMQFVLTTEYADLLFRFSQLPAAIQGKFRTQVEQQLRNFVEDEEASLLECLTIFDTRDRLINCIVYRAEDTCRWIIETHEYQEWRHGKNNRLKLLSPPGLARTTISGFVTNVLDGELEKGDVLAAYACPDLDQQTSSATGILCALAGQIAQSSPAAMERCKKFLERHVSEGQLKSGVLELQDLVVEMSLSADIRQVFVIIDGLDEGVWESPDDVQVVVDIAKYARKVKMFVTSRPCPLIAEALSDYRSLSMDYAESKELIEKAKVLLQHDLEGENLVFIQWSIIDYMQSKLRPS